MKTLTVIELPLADIRLPERQLKQHPKRQIEQIVSSIEAFGFNDPVAVDENHEVIEGVGRVLAAQRLNLTTIPVIRLSHLNQAQKQAYRIAHNKTCLNTDFDLERLQEAFQEICQLDSGLLQATGFEQVELDDLLKLGPLPDLAPELTECLKESVTCPACGEVFHV